MSRISGQILFERFILVFICECVANVGNLLTKNAANSCAVFSKQKINYLAFFFLHFLSNFSQKTVTLLFSFPSRYYIS